ncbi:TBC1 domain family member 4-like protein [Dinothrombium tinctorium]|uniref:TBC1 domain family member 4-like protein n=1 Tax=Dinothrombium tinctorium TaxID=1965070 RepID=A0A3S4QPG4_9ACAR|nr:TBC1 domain family member 4-like protein [Dinothrombium tinctorium]RWS06081.1 TBC1 domain family member 4-like protein [Dinothrombium tinctorium]RWS06085.1 TBC1 domain family member 4-like protein [Dinothrombium tinctorium]RWS06896.1 TBC1 domain family member 4-like protein [Dinothrombium tinctorium]
MGPALFELYSSSYTTNRKKVLSQEKIVVDTDQKKAAKKSHSIPIIRSDDQRRAEVKPKAPIVVSRFRSFPVKFIGHSLLDRRNTLPMLPWIIAEIKRQPSTSMGEYGNQDVILEITDIALRATSVDNSSILFVHPLQNISKFEQTAADSRYFTYLVRDHPDSHFDCYVFQATDENIVKKALNALVFTENAFREKAINFMCLEESKTRNVHVLCTPSADLNSSMFFAITQKQA